MSTENDPHVTGTASGPTTAHGPTTATGTERRDPRSVPDLLGDLAEQVTSLVRTEVALLKAEMRENLNRLSTGGMELGAGALLVQASLVILLIAIVHGLEALGLGFGLSSLITGIVFAGIGVMLLKKGKDNMSPTGLAPDRTQHSVQKDVRLVKEEVR